MFAVIIPVAVAGLAGINYLKRPKDYGVMTPNRSSLYNAALSGSLKDPGKLDKLAAAFETNGLSEQAKLLRQRATLRRLPDSVKEARKAAFRKAMQSKNKPVILEMADAYDKQGCTGAALRLREYASGLPDKIEPQSPEPEPVAAPVDEMSPEHSEPTPEAEVSAPTEVQT